MSRFSSRPRRTRLYDCNYNMSERYYKPMVDNLDRRRPAAPEDVPRHFSPLAAAAEERRRPLSTLFDEAEAPAGRANGHREDSLGMSDEMAASMRRIAASKAARAAIEDEISELSAARSRRKGGDLDFADKVLDAVGLGGREDGDAHAGVTVSRRTLKMTTSATSAADEEGGSLTRWTALKGSGGSAVQEAVDDLAGSAAKMRARMSKNRLADLDAEMEELESRTAARERRNHHLRALLQETRDMDTEVTTTSSRLSHKTDKKTVTF